jgi:hypothetical protein
LTSSGPDSFKTIQCVPAHQSGARAIRSDAGRDGHGTGGRFARCHPPAKDPTRTQQSGKDDRRQAARFRFEPLFDPLSGAK